MSREFNDLAVEVIETARVVLDNLIDADAYGPKEAGEEHPDWPTDEDGDVWYPDVWYLQKALNEVKKRFGI